MFVAVDFDGTCVTHEFPEVGKDIGAVPVLKRLIDNGHQIVLWTIRSGVFQNKETLPLAVNWFDKNNIPLYGVNENPSMIWSSSKKAYAHIYIDDAALGCPLIYNPKISKRPYVDWNRVEQELIERGFILK